MKAFRVTLTVMIHRSTAEEKELLKQLTIFDDSDDYTYSIEEINKVEEVKPQEEKCGK